MTELPVVYGRDCVAGCAVLCYPNLDLLKRDVAEYGAELVVVFLDAVGAACLIRDIREGIVEGADSNIPIIAVDVPSAPEEARKAAIGAMATMCNEEELSATIERITGASGEADEEDGNIPRR